MTRINLVNSIKKDNIIYIAAPFDNYDKKFQNELVDIFKCNTINFFLNNHSMNPRKDFKTSCQLYKIFRSIRPDLVLNFTVKPNIYSTIICKILNIKTINNITGLGTLFTTKSVTSKVGRILYVLSQTLSFKVFFQNKDDLNLFMSYKILNRHKCDILPGSGVNLDFFNSTIQQFNPPEQTRFLYIGKLYREKGIFEMLNAFKIIKEKYPQTKLSLIGTIINTQNKELIEKMVTELSLLGIIEYCGEQDDIRAFINNSDCVVLPSYREGTPRSLLEAAAMGKPILASHVPGCKDVVENGVNGYFFEAKNIDDMINKFETFIKLPTENKKQMGRAGRIKIAKEYDEKIVAEKYVTIISSIKYN